MTERRDRLFLSLADEGGATDRGDGIARDTGCALLLRRLSCIACPLLNSLHHCCRVQYLLPTEADWLGEYGLTVECEMREADAE